MAYISFDPRKEVRTKIGTQIWDKDKGTGYAIQAADSKGKTIYVPIYLSEEVRSEVLANMPFIDVNLALCTYTPQDVGAVTRQHEAYLDFGIWFTDTDNIDVTLFGKTICDEIVNQIRTNQCAFDNISFINVEEVRHIKEVQAHQVVYHYVVTVYVLWYDVPK
jgi:hypothetical protein